MYFPSDALVAELFVQTVLVSDKYLALTEAGESDEDREQADNARRFFEIAKQLPIELQMVLSNRAHSLAKELVLTKDSEPALKAILVAFDNDTVALIEHLQ